VLLAPGGSLGLRRMLLRYLGGDESDEEARDWLNGLLPARIAEVSQPTTIHLFVSKDDQYYDPHVPAIVEAVGANPSIDIDVVESDYVRHSNVGATMWPWFYETLESIVSAPPYAASR
jgi:hypothetical protein